MTLSNKKTGPRVTDEKTLKENKPHLTSYLIFEGWFLNKNNLDCAKSRLH